VLGWYFSDLLLYLFFAFILSLIGKPLARRIGSIHIYKYGISYGVGTAVTMVCIIAGILSALLFFIPVLIGETEAIAAINYDDLSVSLNIWLNQIQDFLHRQDMISSNETLVGIINTEIKKFVSLTSFSDILGGILSVTGSFLFGLFTVLFFTFFFIKDDLSIETVALLLCGKQYETRVWEISSKINHLLSRYFIGLLIEIVSMIFLLYLGLMLFGIKGALLFAVFGGVLNAVPYLGPLIGTITCCLFGIINCLSINDYQSILPATVKIASVFIFANLLDNLLLQPLIYSKSVKAHPVEIFIVIIMAGSLAGIIGMLIAIPIYTILRTIAVELFKVMNTSA
jgi:predicted PurR-regulated permease PerM